MSIDILKINKGFIRYDIIWYSQKEETYIGVWIYDYIFE